MSKQSEAKEKQGYDPRPSERCCKTCSYFRFEMKWPKWIERNPRSQYRTEEYKRMRNLRCAIGNFAVTRQAVCELWEKKEEEGQ